MNHGNAPGFGVSLAGIIRFPGSNGQYAIQFCNQPGYDFTDCPTNDPGSVAARFSQNDEPYSGIGVTQHASVEPGRFEFAQSSYGRDSIIAAAGYDWKDTLYLNSDTLPAGSPVTLSVSIAAVDVDIGLACHYAASEGALDFTGPGKDAAGNDVNVNGFCYVYSGQYGEWYWGPTGTRDSGALKGFIGKPLVIRGHGGTNTENCEGDCGGYDTAALSGRSIWHIDHVPHGVTYTSASGRRY